MSMILQISFDFSKINTQSIYISIIGYVVVFLVLVILYLVFLYLSKILTYQAKQKCKKKGRNDCVENKNFNPSGDVNAAIAMTIYLYLNELHDEESGILTVKRVSRRYSPWNSKIYNVLNNIR